MIEIPLQDFDQSKLENLLRSTPSAYVREESRENFIRKHYLFPRESASFLIKCYGDHFNNSTIPSLKKCSLKVSASPVNDEIVLDVANYGLAPQRIYSTERVYGRLSTGRYGQLFRFLFDCKETFCRLSMTAKVPE